MPSLLELVIFCPDPLSKIPVSPLTRVKYNRLLVGGDYSFRPKPFKQAMHAPNRRDQIQHDHQPTVVLRLQIWRLRMIALI
jgi:hypothetical protein